MMRLRRLGALLLVLALVAGACGGDDAADTTTTTAGTTSTTTGDQTTTTGQATTTTTEPTIEGGTLRVAQGVDPRTLGPWTSVAAELSVTNQIFERLVAYNFDTGGFDAVLAESYEWIDPVTIEFKLREDVSFTNGEPFNADAVLFSFDQLLNPEIGGVELSNRTANMDRVEKIDDSTVRLHYTDPIAQSLNMANLSQSSFMVPPGYFTEVGYADFTEEPVGTGPFMFESRVRDSTITLVKNPDYKGYSGDAPLFDMLEFIILPEPSARVASLESDDGADIIVDLPFDQVPQVDASSDLRSVSIPGLRIYEMQVDTGLAGLSDATPIQEVRQALMVALDRQLIIDALFDGQGAPIGQLATDGYFGYFPDIPPLEYDPARAQELLAEAGFPDGLELQLECPTGRYLKDKEVCEVVSAELAKVGITVPTKVSEVGAYFSAVLAKEAGPMIYIGRLAPSLNVVDMYNSSLCESGDSYNCDPQLEELSSTARAALEPEAQLEAIREMVDYDLNNPHRIPLWVLNDAYGVRQRVQGWEPVADQVLRFWGVGVSN
jgi:peptide/nickel transport system substrate-binding protein